MTSNFFDNELEQLGESKEPKIIVTQHQIEKGVQQIALKLNDKFRGQKVIIVSILKGAVYFFVDLTRSVSFVHSQYHIEMSSYKNNRTQGEVELLSSIKKEKFEGRKVILVDELFDNGTTMKACKEAIHKKTDVPLEDIFTVTLMKKTKPEVTIPLDLYAIDIPADAWLVGYGLDAEGTCRNVKNVYRMN